MEEDIEDAKKEAEERRLIELVNNCFTWHFNKTFM